MKRLLLILSVLFISLTSMGQSQPVEHTGWQIENGGEWGSFYWQVIRIPQGNIFNYYVYTYSNSFYKTKRNGVDYDKAVTYIRDLNVTMNEIDQYGAVYHVFVVNVPYVSTDHVRGSPVAWFWSHSPNNQFYVTFNNATPYSRSIN